MVGCFRRKSKLTSSNSSTCFWSKGNDNIICYQKLEQGFVNVVSSPLHWYEEDRNFASPSISCSKVCKRREGWVIARCWRTDWDDDDRVFMVCCGCASLPGSIVCICSFFWQWFMLLIHYGWFVNIQSSDTVIGSRVVLSSVKTLL